MSQKIFDKTTELVQMYFQKLFAPFTMESGDLLLLFALMYCLNYYKKCPMIVARVAK